MVFFCYFLIPLSLRIATTLSVTLTCFHLVVSTAVGHSTRGDILARQVPSLIHVIVCMMEVYPHLQVISHMLLLLGVNMVGIFYNYLADLAQRKTFSQTRRYLISLTTIEEQKIKKVIPDVL